MVHATRVLSQRPSTPAWIADVGGWLSHSKHSHLSMMLSSVKISCVRAAVAGRNIFCFSILKIELAPALLSCLVFCFSALIPISLIQDYILEAWKAPREYLCESQTATLLNYLLIPTLKLVARDI